MRRILVLFALASALTACGTTGAAEQRVDATPETSQPTSTIVPAPVVASASLVAPPTASIVVSATAAAPATPEPISSVEATIEPSATALAVMQETETPMPIDGSGEAAPAPVPAPQPPPLSRLTPVAPVEPAVTGQAPADLLDRIIVDVMQRSGAARAMVAIIRDEAVTWPDGSLGCPRPGMVYPQVLIDGYWIVAQVDQTTYDYRTDDRGRFIFCDRPNLTPPGGDPTR